ncbi:MAG: ribbon-helix-helix domain-containing protein [Candidatus Hydrothermarchaeota archaeon]
MTDCRLTVRLSNRELRGIDVLVENGVFPNRSEAIREALRKFLRKKVKEEEPLRSIQIREDQHRWRIYPRKYTLR